MNGRKAKWIVLSLGSAIVLILSSVVVVSYRNTITPQGIVVHHSATLPNRILKPSDVQAISANHERRGFSMFYWGRTYNIGYHYLILPDGTVVSGRPETSIGAHATSYNSYLGICLIGDFSESSELVMNKRHTYPTVEQVTALISLTKELQIKYQIPFENVVTHHDVNADTECPGENFPTEVLRTALRVDSY